MPVSPDSIAGGKCYARFSEIRKVVGIHNGTVTYRYRTATDTNAIATGSQSLPLKRFANEADKEVLCPADL